jgi:GNAT superfamily N-acetyltransferase
MRDYRIAELDFEKASENELDSWYRLWVDHFREIDPENPEPGREYLIERMKGLSKTQDGITMALWSDIGEIEAYCRTHVSRAGFRKDAATFGMTVRRDHRRRGIGTALLSHVLKAAENFERSKLDAYHDERCPAAGHFLERIGAEIVSSGKWNQLKLDEVDDDLISEWMSLPSQDNRSIRLDMWDDHYPDEALQEVCDFYQTIIDHQSREDGEEDSQVEITPEFIRSGDQWALSGGRKRLLLHAHDAENGKLIGLTEVLWNPAIPKILKQGYTAVLPDYRGMGIGRRLKAEMIRKIQELIPEARMIRTGNDERRKAILKINSKLGFRHYYTVYHWELTTETLREYLTSSS